MPTASSDSPVAVFPGCWFVLGCWLVLLSAVALMPAPAIASGGPGDDAPGHYLLVIDHSGSMLARLRKGEGEGRTRWDFMRERAAGFVERLPEGSTVWVIVFNAPDPAAPTREWHRVVSADLDSAASRDRLLGLLRNFPEPALPNGTWLNKAIDMALDQVEATGARDPTAYLTVMVYTDGADEGHGRTRAEMQRNGGSPVTRSQLDQRLAGLRQRHPNFNLVNVYQPGDESIRDAHVVRLRHNRAQLPSPLALPDQELAFELQFRDNERLKLTGRPLGLRLTAEDGSPLPLRVDGGPFQLKAGPVQVRLSRDGDWPQGRDVQARLQLQYPEIADSMLIAEGGEVVRITFQGAEAPAIRDLRPETGSVFPLGRELSFSLTTLPGASIEWDFGDGRSATGSPVRHRYTEPGRRTVMAKAVDPRTGLSSTQAIDLDIVRLGLSVDPLLAPAVQGRPVVLQATAEGDFERFEWTVDGRRYAGGPRSDGRPGSRIEVLPDRAGPLQVGVAGDGRRGGRAEADPLVLDVQEVPTLRLTSPADGDVLHYGATREFRAELEGIDAARVRFVLRSLDGRELLPPRTVDVARDGNVRKAVVALTVPELAEPLDGVVEVAVVDAEPALVRSASVAITREPTRIEVILPEGREPAIGREAGLQLESNAPLDDIRWDFGDGKGYVPGPAVTRKAWDRYGAYTIRARARDPEGNPVESAPVAIQIPVRPVSGLAELLYKGRVVGREVDRVPVNATLDLEAKVAGDVARVRWLLDGEELPADQRTITVSRRGNYRLQLVVEGTPEAGRAESTIEFSTSDQLLFWGLFAVLVGLVALAGRVLLGNGWRLAEFRVKTVGEQWGQRDAKGNPDPDGESRLLGRAGSRRTCGRWDWLRKRALLKVSELDNRLPQRLLERGIEHSGFRWGEQDLLEFRGLELPAVRGTLKGSVQLVATEGDLNPRSAGPWLRCWRLPRLQLPPDHPAEFGTLALFVRRRRTPWLQRWWPECGFAMLALAAAVAAYQLHSLLY